MSAEELKVRGELEMDVERDLEAEIKDGIYHLALHLHRLYQQQKERNARELSEPGTKNQLGLTKNKTVSEVNINIRMEGGTKIEIKEIKKEAREQGQTRISRSENTQGMIGSNAKRFDWAKSLRSESRRPLAINKKNDNGPHQAKVISYELNLHQNHKVDHVRRNWTSASGQHKGSGMQNKLLELAWK